MLIPLTGPDLSADPRLDDYTRLKDVKLRARLEPERGLYMAESSSVITRALDAGHSPRSFLMAQRHLPGLAGAIESATGSADGGPVPIFTAPEEVPYTHLTLPALRLGYVVWCAAS